MADSGHAVRALAQGAQPWPDDDALVALMTELRSFNQVALHCGKRRESLRDYLRIRPGLKMRMDDLRPARLTDAEKRASRAATTRRYHEQNAELRRANRRQWMRKKRACKDSIVYEMMLRSDPCSYCGDPATTTDHVIPRKDGGEDHFSNYTAACGRCNDSKGSKSLLSFMLGRVA